MSQYDAERSNKLSLNVGTPNGKFSTVEGQLLAKNVHREATFDNFKYIGVAGMVLILLDTHNSKITYVVNFAERDMLCPNLVPKQALK